MVRSVCGNVRGHASPTNTPIVLLSSFVFPRESQIVNMTQQEYGFVVKGSGIDCEIVST